MTDNRATNFTFNINNNPNTRIDNFLSDQLEQYSRSKISKLIKDKAILVNDRPVKPSYKLVDNDQILVNIPAEKPKDILPQQMDLDILYEDEHYIAVNKAGDVSVHPGAGISEGTLVNGLMYYTKNLSSAGGFERPGLVHRLDKDTTGVLVCAKNDEAHWKLSELFSEREIYKEYRTIVWGHPNCDRIITQPIGRSIKDRKKYSVRDKGKPARTEYEIIQNWKIFSLLKIILHTGRTHQIRVHMKYCHAPVVGDSGYGNDNGRMKGLNQFKREVCREILKIASRQMLHSHKIAFQHPFTDQKIEIVAPLPKDFNKVITILNENEDLLIGY